MLRNLRKLRKLQILFVMESLRLRVRKFFLTIRLCVINMANITKLNESPNLTHQIYPSQQSTRFMSRSKDEFEYFPEEYFCLTDNNFLIINRDGKILQIRPSEFEDGDFLPSVDEKNNFVWAKAICTKRIVPKGDKIVRLCSRGGIF